MNRRLIVVDDESAVLESYRNILNPRPAMPPVVSSRKGVVANPLPLATPDNFDVEYVTTGAQALFLIENGLRDNRPFVGGFFDVKLGAGIDGIETIRLARQMDPNLNCVMVTAFQDRSLDQVTKVLGGDSVDQWDYLAKPFVESEILQKARNLVAGWNKRERQREFVEQLKEQMDQLIKTDRISTVGMVAKGVSHEVANLLLKARWKLEAMVDGEEKAPIAPKDLNAVLKLISEAGGVLGNLQFFVQEDLQQDFFSVEEVLKEALMLTEGTKEQCGAHIDLTVEKDLPPVELSRSKVSHVFVNLLLNALQASSSGEGKIKVRAHSLGNGIAVEFRDNGLGIATENKEKVFEPLFSTKEGHLGIGLTVARRIVEGWGGQLTVASQPAKGSLFTVRIPTTTINITEEV